MTRIALALFVAMLATACEEATAMGPRSTPVSEKLFTRPCSMIGRDTSDMALADAYAKRDGALVLVGDLVVSCECGRRKIGGAKEEAKIGGTKEEAKIGGTKETGKIGGAKETGTISGATEDAKIRGAAESSKIAGATETGKIAGATESSKITGATETGKIAGASEKAAIGGATEGFTCSETASCQGFVFSGTPTAVFGRRGRETTTTSCITAD